MAFARIFVQLLITASALSLVYTVWMIYSNIVIVESPPKFSVHPQVQSQPKQD